MWLLIILYLINKPLRCTECNRKTLVTFTPQWCLMNEYTGPVQPITAAVITFKNHIIISLIGKIQDANRVKTIWKSIGIVIMPAAFFWKHGAIAMFTLSCNFYFLKCTILFLNWFISQVTNWTKVTRILSSKDPLWSLRAFSILNRLYCFISSFIW